MSRKLLTLISLVLCSAVLTGCAAFRQSVKSVDPDKGKSMSAKYDYTDLRSMTDEAVDQLMTEPFIADASAAPMIAIMEFENRTTLHVDTKAMTDSLRKKMRKTRKARFLNASRRDDLARERAYSGANATETTRAKLRAETGAQFIMTGSLTELTQRSGRQVRVSKKEERYYKFVVEVTDVNTGEIVGESEVERVRQQSQPLIGW